MSLCKTAREELGFTQVKFAQWLGEHAGNHINQPQIAAYEIGTRNMGEKYRKVCTPLAVKSAVDKIALLNPDGDNYFECAAEIITESMK